MRLISKVRTQQETADILGVSKTEVHKRERNAIRKINRALRGQLSVRVAREGIEVLSA